VLFARAIVNIEVFNYCIALSFIVMTYMFILVI